MPLSLEIVRHNHAKPALPILTVALVELDELDERLGNQKDRKPKSMNFFSKFIQLQDLMFAHNAGLTASHPYASSPSSWPFAKKGISFWTQNEGHKQIYLVGNLVGWWTAAGAVFLIFGIFPASIFAERRNIPVLSDCKLQGYQDVFVVLTSLYSRHPSFMELVWLLRCDLGGTLRAFLPLQPTALFAPLSPCTPRFRFDRRCCSQLHLHRNSQLSNFVPWIRYAPETEGVR